MYELRSEESARKWGWGGIQSCQVGDISTFEKWKEGQSMRTTENRGRLGQEAG